MKIYIYIFSLFITMASCSQSNNYKIQTIQEETHVRVEIKDPYSQKPMYEISYPKDWEFHQVNDTNNIYITNLDGLKVEGETMNKSYAYSDNKSVLSALNFSNQVVNKILTIEEIIQIELVSKFKREGYERLKTYPLNLINNNSIYYSNSTFRYPEKVKTYATEWTNDKGQKKLCFIQYIKDASIYTVDGIVTKFEYSAEIMTIRESDFDDFKSKYIKSLESVEWNKSYLDNLFNKALSASTNWKYQMVVRKEPLVSYLRSLEFHNQTHSNYWKKDQICMGITLPDTSSSDYLDTNNYYDASIDYNISDWNEINN